MSTSDNHDLIDLARSGDVAAFDAIIRAHREAAVSFAQRITRNRDDAEDVVQCASLRAWGSCGGFNGYAFGAWFYRIVRNYALSFVRRRDFLDIAADESRLPDETDDPLRNLERYRLRWMLQRSVDSLPVSQRNIFLLRECDELTVKETMAAESIPLGTVVSRMHRARHRMQELMRSEWSAPPRQLRVYRREPSVTP